jgi:transposase
VLVHDKFASYDRFTGAVQQRCLAHLLRRAGANEALAKHIGTHFASWFTFLPDASVPATSWAAGQAVWPAVVNRKVSGGNRTAAGARAVGVLSSVLQTCQQQARAPVDFVSRTLHAFGNRMLPTPLLSSSGPANQVRRN